MTGQPASRRRIVLIGAGGHAGVLIDTLAAARAAERTSDTIVAAVDDDPARYGGSVLGVPVTGGLDSDHGGTHFIIAVGSAGDARHRALLFRRGIDAGLRAATIVHPSAVVSPGAHIDEGAAVLAGAIVQVSARIGANVILNSGSIVEHDAVIGAHSHVSPNATVLGLAHVGACCHVGAGAVVVQRVRLGDGAVVGAGAVVAENVAERTVVAGVPARALRVLDP